LCCFPHIFLSDCLANFAVAPFCGRILYYLSIISKCQCARLKPLLFPSSLFRAFIFDLISGLRFWNARHINTLRKHKEIEIGAHFHSMPLCGQCIGIGIGSTSNKYFGRGRETLCIRQDISTLNKLKAQSWQSIFNFILI